MHEERFSVAKANFTITANFPIRDWLLDPQPYSLHTRFLFGPHDPGGDNITIEFVNEANPITVSASSDRIVLRGDFSPMFNEEHNKQFSLFGNKGIVHRIILSTLESKYGIGTLHACAVVHPEKKRICIVIGSSGSGKSAFVSGAVKANWKLITTEHVLIGVDGAVYKGNQYDNVSSVGGAFIKQYLSEAVVHEDRSLVEPVASRSLADYSKYGIDYKNLNLADYELVLASPALGNPDDEHLTSITDRDFYLRIVQWGMSEKISFPMIFADTILPDSNLTGDAAARTKIVQNLLAQASKKVILRGTFSKMERWIQDEYDR